MDHVFNQIIDLQLKVINIDCSSELILDLQINYINNFDCKYLGSSIELVMVTQQDKMEICYYFLIIDEV